MHNPNFSSGPCSKRPGWSIEALKDAAVGRSHRSSLGKGKLLQAIKESKELLRIPEDYLLGIFTGSDTGAFEAALWALLGPRPVTVLVWESFGEDWATDVAKELKLNPTILKADYGEIPDLQKVDWSDDVGFVANGTTRGVKIPHWDWIPESREGLSLCDGTSAVFAMDIDWSKVDALTFSWQKCLGSEAGFGMLVLSPRAVERIESYNPPWPIPKLFRMKKGGKINRGIFAGDIINTPSLLCVEDYLDALKWAKSVGLEGLIARSKENLKVVEEWVKENPWIDFLAKSPEIRSNTSVCLSVVDEEVMKMDKDKKAELFREITQELSKKAIAHDIASYREAPLGFRFWCGPTISPDDLRVALGELASLYKEKMSQRRA